MVQIIDHLHSSSFVIYHKVLVYSFVNRDEVFLRLTIYTFVEAELNLSHSWKAPMIKRLWPLALNFSFFKELPYWDFISILVVKTSPSNAGGVGSTPDHGAKIHVNKTKHKTEAMS